MFDTLRGRWLAAFTICLWVVLLIAGVAAAQEASPLPFMPTLLEDGVTVQEQFADNVTARLYAFNGTQGDSISLHMHGDFDSYMVLLGSGGEFLAYNDDAEDVFFGDSELVDFELPYSGRYYVLATSYEHLDDVLASSPTLPMPQPYEIVLTGNTPPSDGAMSALDASVVATGAETERVLTAEQPIGFFSFDGQQDSIAGVDAVSDDVMYLMVHVFAPDGSRIGMTHDPEDEPLDTLILPQDGEYLVVTMDAFFVDRLLPNAGDYGLGSVFVQVTEG
ncbi:MAG: PPC domain-containing protein [Anaerolineae bacterium]|nr:PPC domain-containing protein [Anaerolineae bacterium]